MNLREMILAANDLPVTPVEVSEWGATVYVKSLSGAERLTLEKDISHDAKTDGPALARVVCATLCDEAGHLLFRYPDDIAVINGKSVKALTKVFNAAIKANAMSKDDVDGLQKN